MENQNKYRDKYLKYKIKYLELRQLDNTDQIEHNLEGGGGGKKCIIEDTDRILFGDGGSTAIIAISRENNVYKFFINHIETLSKFKKINQRIKLDDINNEINIYKLLTEKIKKNIIPNHYVNYIGDCKCSNVEKLFSKCPDTYIKFLNEPENTTSRMCQNKFINYPNTKLLNDYRVIEIEYCNYSSKDFINDISKMDIYKMEKLLDIFFFQIIYTIVKTKKEFPYFSHNDLFMRNILGKKEIDNNNYYEYNYDKITFIIPQILFFPKINDFGLTNLNKKYCNTELFQNDYKDIYNILLDVYDGGNLGAESLTKLLQEDNYKKDFLNKYFSNFFNVNKIQQFKKNNNNNINWDWNNILSDEYRKEIEIKHPDVLLKNYFYPKFKNINKITKI